MGLSWVCCPALLCSCAACLADEAGEKQAVKLGSPQPESKQKLLKMTRLFCMGHVCLDKAACKTEMPPAGYIDK